MSQVYDILTTLSSIDATIELADSSGLKLSSPNGTPEHIVEQVRRHKPELLAMLERSVDLPHCDCGGRVFAVPTFDNFENLECLDCGRCSGCRPGRLS